MDDAPEKPAPPSSDQTLIKIGDFARLAGTNLRTLRYYEELGLLRPAARSAGGFRFYRPGDLDRLRMIERLQGLGLELARIRELLDTRAMGRSRTDFLGPVRAALQAQARLIDERMAELARQRRDVEQALEKTRECETCGHHPGPGNDFCHPCQVDGSTLPADLSALF